MNNFYKQTLRLAALAVISLVALPAQAQLSNVGEILQAGANDANLLANEYLKPIGRGFGAGLNSGWYFSANPHKFLGFDVAIRVGLAQVPDADLTYNVQNLTFQRLQLKSGKPAIGPTFSGDKTTVRPVFEITETYTNPVTNQQETVVLSELEMPNGLGVSFVPTAMVQAGVGLIFNTDVSVRFMPETEIEDFGTISLIGASVKHGLNQWIPGGDLLPVDLSIQAGFTQLSATAPLSIDPDAVGADAQTYNSYIPTHWDGQQVEFKSSGYTVNALVGKNINFLILGIGVYGGVGIESATTTVKTPGNYPILTPVTDLTLYAQGYREQVESISTPLDLSFDSANSLRFTAGARVRFLLVNVIAEYTYANYQMLNAGVAISLR